MPTFDATGTLIGFLGGIKVAEIHRIVAGEKCGASQEGSGVILSHGVDGAIFFSMAVFISGLTCRTAEAAAVRIAQRTAVL